MGSHVFSMMEMNKDTDEEAHRGLSESNLKQIWCQQKDTEMLWTETDDF